MTTPATPVDPEPSAEDVAQAKRAWRRDTLPEFTNLLDATVERSGSR